MAVLPSCLQLGLRFNRMGGKEGVAARMETAITEDSRYRTGAYPGPDAVQKRKSRKIPEINTRFTDSYTNANFAKSTTMRWVLTFGK